MRFDLLVVLRKREDEKDRETIYHSIRTLGAGKGKALHEFVLEL